MAVSFIVGHLYTCWDDQGFLQDVSNNKDTKRKKLAKE